MLIPPSRYRCPLAKALPQLTNLEAMKRDGWREQRILVVNATDERLDFVEREFIRRIGERLYGGKHHG